jgi:hypothetical protein
MQMAHCLLTSTHLHMDLYVFMHQTPLLLLTSSCYPLNFTLMVCCMTTDLMEQLHQLMVPILTCLVNKRLFALPSEDHWSLRQFSAALVAYVCNHFGHSYPNVQPRITKVSHYCLPPTNIVMLVLVNMAAYDLVALSIVE